MAEAQIHPLVQQVLSNEAPELRILAAQGLVPLPFEDLVELQVVLAEEADRIVADMARASLQDIEVSLGAEYLGSGASQRVLRYFGSLKELHPILIEAIVRRRDVPRDLLSDLAARANAELQERILLRQDAILEAPEILDALEANPSLSNYSRRRIREYREHLLPRQREEVAAEEALLAELPELDESDRAAIDAVRQLPTEGEVDERTGLSEIQIRALPVPTRMKLTRGAGRTLRSILVRDTNAQVAVSVLLNSAFSEEEIELVAASRSVVDDVLTTIERKRDWISRYNVALNLARNPRTPAGTAIRLLSRLSVRDLKGLAHDRNISESVRSGAQRLYRIKQR